ncbi:MULTISPECIES: tetratricopeptide repeat protein [Sphingobacterium]|uniref:tetratricopeptide repeat protein n=1 Tax=Sphingobacterium TaxID=28453 RepID=UPI00257D6C3D|nr:MULTISPECIES: tetratricopeptide repeat protein [Sphingobacterium]
MKTLFSIFIVCLLTFKTIAADSKQQQVDSLLNKTKEFHNAGKLLPQLETAMKALNSANELGDKKGNAKAHFWVAEVLFKIGLYREGFQYLKQLQALKFDGEDLEFQAETHGLKGKGYIGLNLLQQAHQEFHVQLTCAKKLKDKLQRKNLVHAFGNLATVFSRLGKPDSVLKYNKLQLDVLLELNEKENVLLYLDTYDGFGNFYTQRRDFAKAELYLNKSLDLVNKYQIPTFFNTKTYLGNLEKEKRNYKKALIYFEESLANMEKVGAWDAIRGRYKFLVNYYRYHKFGSQKVEKYEMGYTWINDSLEKKNKEIIDVVMDQIKRSKEKEAALRVSKLVSISIIALILLVVVITFFVWRVRHNRELLAKKEEALEETEIMNQKLTGQIAENKFNNLIDLAKSNNPEFLTLFTELYPQFIQSLKLFDPNIRTTELEFCAMAFLNFTTKNIAEYTFVTVRAVQVRKNRLRKKLEIPSVVDFNTWMRGLAENEEQNRTS